MSIEAFFFRLGAQRARLRAAVGGPRADLVQFAFLCLLLLPWYCLLVLPQSAPWFGLLAGPGFLIGWFGLSLGMKGTETSSRNDRLVMALAAACALISFAAFAVAVLNRPRPPAPEAWEPPAGGVLETEVTRPR